MGVHQALYSYMISSGKYRGWVRLQTWNINYTSIQVTSSFLHSEVLRVHPGLITPGSSHPTHQSMSSYPIHKSPRGDNVHAPLAASEHDIGPALISEETKTSRTNQGDYDVVPLISYPDRNSANVQDNGRMPLTLE